jgi:hypothetical protein
VAAALESALGSIPALVRGTSKMLKSDLEGHFLYSWGRPFYLDIGLERLSYYGQF